MRNRLTPAGIVALSGLALVACSGGTQEIASPSPFAPALPFHDGFEEVPTFSALFSEDGSRWHGQQIDPQQNSANLASDRAHSGEQSVKFYADRYDGFHASKADLQLTGLTLAKGDHVWFSGWYFLEDALDSRWLFLWDLEDTNHMNSPGRRLYLSEGEALASDLGKWWTGDVFRQSADRYTPFPKDRWVELVVHLYLSEGKDGVMEVWQDQSLVLSAEGQTLPTATSTYDRLQVGITANGNQDHAQVLYVDEITLSIQPLR